MLRTIFSIVAAVLSAAVANKNSEHGHLRAERVLSLDGRSRTAPTAPAAGSMPCDDSAWTRYKVRFAKAYQSQGDEGQARAAWCFNLGAAIAFNGDSHGDGDVDAAKHGETPFSDLFPAQFRARLLTGLLPPADALLGYPRP